MPPVSSTQQLWKRMLEAAIVTLILGAFASTSVGLGKSSVHSPAVPPAVQFAWANTAK